MIDRSFSMGIFGMDAFAVEVEADLSMGLPSFDLVGLPDAAVKESRDRVRAAMKNCGFDFPASRITMNLAPADVRKEGPIYDLPLLIALLKVTGQLPKPTDDCVFIGELSLGGVIRPVKGVLPMAIKARDSGFKRLFIPAANAAEAAVVAELEVYPAASVIEVLEHLRGTKLIERAKPMLTKTEQLMNLPDFADVKGQEPARRALEIAASGGHNILLIGPPGSGKSMLSKRIPSILPDMTAEEAIETTKIHSVAGSIGKNISLLQTRPFRSPHHTISVNGLSGGGSNPRPGEISLAHNGVLFLDEFPEFSRGAMEILRQPMEDEKITISRVFGSVTYPCSFMLVAAMNPCPCGYFGHPTRQCTCSPTAVNRYMSKVSGPILDRIDLHVEVPPVEYDQLAQSEKGESSAVIRERVNRAREIQNNRFKGTGINCNAHITAEILREAVEITSGAQDIFKSAFERFGLSARAYDRVIKVSLTISDLCGSDKILPEHAAEAIQYRSLDRKYWLNEY